MTIRLFCFLLAFCLNSMAFAQIINSGASLVTFEVSNLGKTVTGTLSNMEGVVVFDVRELDKARFEVTIDPATVQSGAKGRDKHLQRDDFFHVEDYPLIRMVSKRITKTEDGYQAVAELTIKDYKKEVVIPFRVEAGETGPLYFTGSFTLARKDYDLATNMGKMMIGLEVTVHIKAVVN